ncbi:hypothetical protein ACFWA4_39675 [Streptomyces sp. NPDC060011]|uniref:hypothetical protein n=1 Tax=unclassified Streptomyces TaxID=2593676 RepID=UPI002DDC6993|nr:hypothetical protein [Streptomyces sp. NBC_01558]WSD75838.1 hypothetical protein OHB33_05755 [Streptomyces sp. NBC_01558]
MAELGDLGPGRPCCARTSAAARCSLRGALSTAEVKLLASSDAGFSGDPLSIRW